MVGKITDLCWEKCVNKPGASLSDAEKNVPAAQLTPNLLSILFSLCAYNDNMRAKSSDVPSSGQLFLSAEANLLDSAHICEKLTRLLG